MLLEAHEDEIGERSGISALPELPKRLNVSVLFVGCFGHVGHLVLFKTVP